MTSWIRAALIVTLTIGAAACAAPAPAAPPGPQLTLTGQPANDRDEVTVAGTGFAPGSTVELVQCAGTAAVGAAAPEVCDVPESVPAVTDPSGAFTIPFTVRSVIGFGGRREEVCPEATCSLGVASSADLSLVALAPLSWSGDTRIPPAPQLTLAELALDPADNTGTAAVTGRGYVAGSEVRLVQCPAAAAGTGVDGGDCLYDEGISVDADERGEFRVDMPVYPLFQRSSGELIDCRTDPAVCVVADPWPSDPGNRLSAVSFATAG